MRLEDHIRLSTPDDGPGVRIPRVPRHAGIYPETPMRIPRNARVNWPVVWVILADFAIIAAVGWFIWAITR